MSKFLNEGDFFMCTGGMMPAKMKSGQVTTGKKSAVKYIRITDVQTTSFGDFVCKKLMLLMAVAAVLFALLCAVTGGAALIAAAAIGGAVGAAAGALICGTKAAAARKWLIPKQQVYINGQLALTDGSYMTCTAVGTEQIRLAPHIKNWWQAMAVGVTNFAGEMFKCVMVGAAAAGGIALLTEGVGAFLSNAAANYLLTWTSGWGLALRGTIGVMGAVQSKYVGGDSTGDAILHGVQGSTYGMEQGTAQSMGNIATGQGKMEDYAALLAWGAPIAPEANKGPIDADAMGNPWEGKPQSGKTGFLESERMSRSELQEYKQGLNDQGVDFQIDKKGVLPDNARAGFDPNNGKVYLRKGATNYEAFHEAQHAKQWGELGKDAYLKQSRAEREQYVYDQIMKNKGQFSDAELKHARDYINDVRSKEGMPPVLDAMEGGTPKKGEDGDLFEDPMAAKEREKAKDEEAAKPVETVRGVTATEFKDSVPEFTNGKNPELADQAWDLWKNQKWGELEKLFNDNNLNGGWPPNRGFTGVENVTLDKDFKFDRFGGYIDRNTGEFKDGGGFIADKGAPFEDRALPASYDNGGKPLNSYNVLKPIDNVKKGPAIPWFGQKGMGTQYELPPGGIDGLLNNSSIARE